MKLPFLDRTQEKARCLRLVGRQEGSLGVLYGRRRCGKSRLLREILPSGRSVYYVGDDREAGLQRAALAAEIGRVPARFRAGQLSGLGFAARAVLAAGLARHGAGDRRVAGPSGSGSGASEPAAEIPRPREGAGRPPFPERVLAADDARSGARPQRPAFWPRHRDPQNFAAAGGLYRRGLGVGGSNPTGRSFCGVGRHSAILGAGGRLRRPAGGHPVSGAEPAGSLVRRADAGFCRTICAKPLRPPRS